MTALRIFLIMTMVTGILYPVGVTVMSQTLFYQKAQGSIVYQEGIPRGSLLIAQSFESDCYFHGRPSAVGYNPLPSGGSNLSPASQKFRSQLKLGVPSDLVMASGSGLDPHLSPEAAFFQVNRVAQARGFDEPRKEKLKMLVQNSIQKPDFGILGENRVTVLALNMALDTLE